MIEAVDLFVDDQYEEISESSYDPIFELTYKLMIDCFGEQFTNATKVDIKLLSPVTFKSRSFQKFFDLFNKYHADSLSTRSNIVRELFILHQFVKAVHRYNIDVLKVQYTHFRSHFYFPNIIYLLIRFLPEARTFIQKNIKTSYASIQKKNSKLIHLFENSIYTDVDVIKTDILYYFLGNIIKKINPYEIKNINAFFRQVFLNCFFYYFKNERSVHSTIVDSWGADGVISEIKSANTRDGMYREVLTSLQVENYREISPTMKQLHYNFSIFKNVIITNEFQTMFLTSQTSENKSFYNIDNSQYKVLSFYNQMTTDENFLKELKKIPLIYKLLKSVHLVTKNTTSKITSIKPEVIQTTVVEELSLPFRNILRTDTSIIPVLQKIAENFVMSIIVGEYVNLQTLAPIKVDQLSFLIQLRKFIKLCLLTPSTQEIFRGKFF